ncbi:hypothetical protein GXM_03760 [Nostoc sphaeroides CCNUC1]|uniref:Uncharacterized protein n=1 Tax=Nostoc sphaeroides CCNUC1 TaxID=2653204 RepID=A0A5P8W0T7_9NOSO|nr:hypothetical protein GXM_03760 [Nostoc sphaeroides CCNUC1]
MVLCKIIFIHGISNASFPLPTLHSPLPVYTNNFKNQSGLL